MNLNHLPTNLLITCSRFLIVTDVSAFSECSINLRNALRYTFFERSTIQINYMSISGVFTQQLINYV